VDGRDIPLDKQVPVFSNRSLGKAQAVCDALNGGLLASIGSVTAAERARVRAA
jgi:hypothetical protein